MVSHDGRNPAISDTTSRLAIARTSSIVSRTGATGPPGNTSGEAVRYWSSTKSRAHPASSAAGKDEQCLEDVGLDDDRPVNPDCLQDPYLLPAVHGIDEDDNEDDNHRDDKADDRADDVDDVKAADNGFQEISGFVLPGPDLFLDPVLHQGDAHGILIAGRLRLHQDLVCRIRCTQHGFQFFSRDEGTGVDTELSGCNDPLDAVLPGYPVPEGDLNRLSHVHAPERWRSVHFLVFVAGKGGAYQYLPGIAIVQVIPADNFGMDFQHLFFIIGIDCNQERCRGFSLADNGCCTGIPWSTGDNPGNPVDLLLELRDIGDDAAGSPVAR